VNDSRLQQVLDDINEATRHRKAAEACIDDARTHLATIAEESPSPKLLAMIHLGIDDLNNTIHANDCDRLKSAHTIIKRASEVTL